MLVPKELREAKGSWKGKSRLHLSWLPPEQRIHESEATATVDVGEQSAFATIAYTWHHEGKKHDGAILACIQKEGTIEYAWLDSWHQGTIMCLEGPIVEGAPLKGKGTYKYEDQVWGWTIALSLSDDVFSIKMENVDLEGEAEWAVEAVYTRA